MHTTRMLVMLGALIAAGCGGGGSGTPTGGDDDPEFQTLFFDAFDSFPSADWTIAPYASPNGGFTTFPPASGFGGATRDDLVGVQAPPSLRLLGATQATAFAGAFPTAGGLQIYARVRLPPDDVSCLMESEARLVELVDNGSGEIAAAIVLHRATCGGTSELVYGVWPDPDRKAHVGLQRFSELLGPGTIDGQTWYDFSFIMLADGRVLLRRDGVVRLATTLPLDSSHLTLRLGGIYFRVEFPGVPFPPDVPVHFDDVWVAKPD